MPLGESAPDPERFAREVPALLAAVPEDRRPTRLAIEPGRALVARRGLAGGERPPRPRPRRAPGRHRCRHDRADPAGAVRRSASDRCPDLARPVDRARRHGGRSNPPGSKARSANRPTRWACTTCRRCAGGIWSRSATQEPMPHRSRRPTTAGRGPRRSWSRWTATCVAPGAHGRRRSLRIDGMTRHRSPIVVLATLRVAVRDLDWRRGRRVAGSIRAAARPTVPGSRGRPGRLRLRGHPVARGDRFRGGGDRRDRGADRLRGRRLHPGQRRLSHDRRDRGEGAGPDGPVGRRSQGLQRRAGHLLRHAAEPRARPGPAVRRPGLRGGLPVERGAPVDLPERHAALARGRRLRRAPSPPRSRRSTPRRRPSTPTPSSAPARSTRSSAWSVARWCSWG